MIKNCPHCKSELAPHTGLGYENKITRICINLNCPYLAQNHVSYMVSQEKRIPSVFSTKATLIKRTFDSVCRDIPHLDDTLQNHYLVNSLIQASKSWRSEFDKRLNKPKK
jgi:hypothetical protein